MSITNIKKRIACFYDDKGEFLAKKGFSKTDKLIKYADRAYNVFQDDATSTLMKRWYWDIEQYHYNINNPNPLVLNKKCEPIMDAESYNIHLETKVLKDLNTPKDGLFGKLDFKVVIIILIIIVVGYYLLSGRKVT